MHNFCKSLQNNSIDFAVIVNNRGREISGHGDYNLNDDKKHMMFMGLVLEMSMRKDLNNIEGEIDYIAAKRKNHMIMSIPYGENLLIVFARPNEDPTKIVEFVRSREHFRWV